MSKEESNLVVKGFDTIQVSTPTKMYCYTTIDPADIKRLYNLDNIDCDFRLNDCKGQAIRVVDVLIKNFEKFVDDDGNELDKPITKKVTILIDDAGKTYVTASKIFAIQMERFIGRFGNEAIKNGLEIKITEKEIKGSKNKGLGFELI